MPCTGTTTWSARNLRHPPEPVSWSGFAPTDCAAWAAWRYAQVGDDPFTQLEAEKRERVKSNKKRQSENVKAMSKAGHALPPTLKLAAGLPEHGTGRGQKRKALQTEVCVFGGEGRPDCAWMDALMPTSRYMMHAELVQLRACMAQQLMQACPLLGQPCIYARQQQRRRHVCVAA